MSKKITISFIFILSFLLVLTLPIKAQEKNEKLGVLKVGGEVDENYLKSAQNLLTQAINQLGRFNLIEREEIDKILKEQRFQQSGIVDSDQAAEIGNILAIDTAVVGSIDSLNTDYQTSDAGDYYRTDVSITVKFIDVESAETLHSIEVSSHALDEDKDQSRQEALENAFSQDLLVELRAIFAIESTIVRIEDNQIFFTSGEEMGVKEGRRYEVHRKEDVGSEIVDDKEAEENFTEQIGVVEVTDVLKGVSKAEVVWSDKDIQEGDLVREMPANSKNRVAFRMSRNSYDTGEFEDEGAFTYQGIYGWETPYKYESGFIAGFTTLEDANIINLGFEIGPELNMSEVASFIVKGEGGLAQAWIDNYHYGSTTSRTFYLKGSAGLKIYTSSTGPRLEGGVYRNLLYNFTTDYYSDTEIDGNNFGFYFSLSIPFGQAEGKEQEITDPEKAQENIKRASNILETIEDVTD